MPESQNATGGSKAKQQRVAEALCSFGQCVTADHILAHGRMSHGAGGQTDALVVLNRATGWLNCFPLGSKSADDTVMALLEFTGRQKIYLFVYRSVIGAHQSGKGAQDQAWHVDTLCAHEQWCDRKSEPHILGRHASCVGTLGIAVTRLDICLSAFQFLAQHPSEGWG